MSKLRALLALILLPHAAACGDDAQLDATTNGSAATGTTDAGTTDAGGRDFSSFDRALEEAIAAHNQSVQPAQAIRGASAVIVDRERGIVHEKGYGAYPANRLYLIASASKILSVGVLMRLADQGKLDLDAPVSQYLTPWGANKTNVSVAQLVSNSSGLPSLDEISTAGAMATTNPAAFAPYLPHLCQYREAGTLADCGKSIYTDALPANNRPPDQEFRYGGSQWQLAGAVAEQVSGKSWAELIDETYVKPCAVPSLGYTNPFEKSPSGYPANFDGNLAALPTTSNPSVEGGAYITAADYGKLLWMHLRGGKCGDTQVLSAESVARMQKDRVGGPDGYAKDVGTREVALPGYGLGWWVNDTAGFVADPGAYGAYPVLDAKRGYAMFIVIELTTAVGTKLALATKPVLDRLFDE